MMHLRSFATLLLSFAVLGAARAAPLSIGVAPSLGPAVSQLNVAFAKDYPGVEITVAIATTPALQKQLLVDNPMRLYWT